MCQVALDLRGCFYSCLCQCEIQVCAKRLMYQYHYQRVYGIVPTLTTTSNSFISQKFLLSILESKLKQERSPTVFRPRTHTVHYLVLSAGQFSHTFGIGIALDRLPKVLSTGRYRLSQATEGQGTDQDMVLQVPVHTVRTGRYGHRTHCVHVKIAKSRLKWL